MSEKKLILSLDEAFMLEDPQDPGPWDGNAEDIPACTDWLLRTWAYENKRKPGEKRSLIPVEIPRVLVTK